MKLVPYIIVIAVLSYAGFTKSWFDLAWSAVLTFLVCMDSIVSSINATSTGRKA